MSARLPLRLDPVKECQREVERSGVLPLTRMKRLAAMLQVVDASARCSLKFSIQGKGHYRLEGRVQVDLQLECQRCLHPMLLSVDREFRLALLQSDSQAEHIGEDWEPFVLSEESLDISELIEDELILAIPDIPRHIDERECQPSDWQSDKLDELEIKPENPFAVLTSLKKH
ncbi:MAG: hypothetical protein DSZ28_01450 [Thiothrix sp.]|nr:MAG: hypothetical protein DSZ28_01450 [Thiothrix sp.]